MALFGYKVRSPQGNILTGTVEAREQRMAVDRLRGQRFIVLEIGEIKKRASRDILDSINFLKKKVKQKDLVLFSRQLSTLIGAGVPIVQGLTILLEQIENPAFKKVIASVREDIESGTSITEALGRHPTVFSELYVNMVKSGELGGILDIILERLSAYQESAAALRGKIKSAMIYPAAIALVAGGVTMFLIVVIFPTFVKIFEQAGARLPLPTQILLAVSNFLRRYIIFVIIGLIAFVVGLRQYYKTEAGSMYIDRLLLRFPLFGPLLRKVAVAKFTKTFGTLVKSGVPILQALETVAKTSGNRVIEKAVLQAKESIREGERISDPLKASGVFPPMVTQMISVGEETGNLDAMLSKIAEFYEQEVDAAVSGLTSLIEPVIVVFMGVVIGAIAVAMYMPMFELGGLVGR
ncbi:MAG: type II secretion system F family protein [Elusimicrobiota bacterium]|nr:type II secretion system F family protein [Elusimicrobiota bacterium]MDH5661445.1 type II secretion system F family protein [Elusimicrobiota bacterium]